MKKLLYMICCVGMLLTLGACGADTAETDTAGADIVSGDKEESAGAPEQESEFMVAVRILINPEMVLYLDENRVVVEAKMMNQDAEDMCSAGDLVGKPYDGALGYVVSQAVEQGYVHEENDRVDVSVVQVAEETVDCSFVLENAKTVIREVAEEHDITLRAMTNEVDIDIWQQYEAMQPDNMPDFCGVCGGTGICKNCRGTQKLLCGECEGSRVRNCFGCGGAGTLSGACENCQGLGTMDCPRCHGTGMMVCPRCNGTMIQSCEWCLGDGKNHVTTTHDGRPLASGEYDPVCAKCKGTGTKVCTDCSNGYSQCESNTGERCDNGRVVCDACGGSGSLDGVPCEQCENGKISCTACDGNGETPCPYCTGSGSCADCGGMGIR